MATGTGKTRLAAAIIDRFLNSHQAERVLFIVDRIELAKQALEAFQLAFRDKYKSVRYKQGKHGEWGGASVVIATIQSLNIHYKKDFTPGYFDIVFNDECHRSIYGELPRQVVEYFQATRIGLTATPRDFLKNINIEELSENNPKALEYRIMRDTYKHFGCEPGEPTYRYSIQDAVNAPHPGPYLVPSKIYKLYLRSQVKDEKEKPKFLRKAVFNEVKKAGFSNFGPSEHTFLWKSNDAKNPVKGYGIDICGTWYWYQKWIDFIIAHLSEGQTLKETAYRTSSIFPL